MNPSSYRLVEKIFFHGHIDTLSGLLIGGSDTALEIGGLSKTVVRNPADGRPYIPGSSLKGKLRSLLELSEGRIGGPSGGPVLHGPCLHPESDGARLCGSAIDGGAIKRLQATDPQAPVREGQQRPSPLIVRDALLVSPVSPFPHADLGWTHTKTEVCIDRITAKANPRTIERVPPGARFQLALVLNIFEDEKEKLNSGFQDVHEKRSQLMALVYEGLRLLNADFLGGGGSRGSGQVRIQLNEVIGRDMAWYAQAQDDKTNHSSTVYTIPSDLRV